MGNLGEIQREILEIYKAVWNGGVKGDTRRFVTDAGKSDRDAERSAGDTEGSGGGTERFEWEDSWQI
jgi:hypothetical protein